MRHVNLYVAAGGYVVSGMIPPFRDQQGESWPVVLFWGTRVFRDTGRDRDGGRAYEECFCFALTPECTYNRTTEKPPQVGPPANEQAESGNGT